MSEAERKCLKCGTVLVRRGNETLFVWQRRKFCSRACNSQSRRAWGNKMVEKRSYYKS